jgi:hypothetical protein
VCCPSVVFAGDERGRTVALQPTEFVILSSLESWDITYPRNMQVEVTLSVSEPPRKSNLESLQIAASELTNQQDSITINVLEEGDHFFLVITFSMPKAAQYKIVARVHQTFKFWTLNLEGYEDMMISFPS